MYEQSNHPTALLAHYRHKAASVYAKRYNADKEICMLTILQDSLGARVPNPWICTCRVRFVFQG
jgi:RIO-like serine/threonine protein kinase